MSGDVAAVGVYSRASGLIIPPSSLSLSLSLSLSPRGNDIPARVSLLPTFICPVSVQRARALARDLNPRDEIYGRL